MHAAKHVLRLGLWLVLLVWSVELFFVVLMTGVLPRRVPPASFVWAAAYLLLIILFSGYARDAVWPRQEVQRSFLRSGVRVGTLVGLPFFLLSLVSGLMTFEVAFWSARAFLAGFLAGIIWRLYRVGRKRWKAGRACNDSS